MVSDGKTKATNKDDRLNYFDYSYMIQQQRWKEIDRRTDGYNGKLVIDSLINRQQLLVKSITMPLTGERMSK
jgi:hypothetical protein